MPLLGATLVGATGLFGAAAVAARPAALDPGAVVAVAAGMVVTGVVAATGFLTERGRGRWLLGTVVITFSVLWPVHAGFDAAGVGALATGSGAAVAAAGSAMRRPAEKGAVAESAAAVSLLLVPWPLAIGLAAGNAFGVVDAAIAAAGWVLLLLYTQTAPGAWLLVRLLIPAFGVVMAINPWPRAAFAVVPAALVATASLAASSRRAASPEAVVRGEAFPMPPEMAPREVLEDAGIDERGTPR